MKPEAGKVYRRGDGARVHIIGPARRDDKQAAWWALEGDHYSEAGRMIGREAADHLALSELIGEHSDGGRGDGRGHFACTVCYAETE